MPTGDGPHLWENMLGLEEASAGTQVLPSYQRGGVAALATLLTQKKCAAPEAG